MTIKEAREKQNMSIRELAKRLNLSHPLIIHYENGTRKPTDKRLEEIAHILNVSVDTLKESVATTEYKESESAQQRERKADKEKLSFKRLSKSLISEYLESKQCRLTSAQIEEEDRKKTFDFMFQFNNKTYFYDTHSFYREGLLTREALTKVIGDWVLFQPFSENEIPVLVINSQDNKMDRELISKIQKNTLIHMVITVVNTEKGSVSWTEFSRL